MASEFASRFNQTVADALKLYSAKPGGYSALLGIEVREVLPGKVVCAIHIRPEHMNGVGTVHGGAMSSLADHALSLSVYPLVEPGKWVATTEFKINYLDSAKSGELVATGTVLSLRTRLAVARVDITNEARVVAAAQGTLYIRDPR